jgi:nucleoside phosphorylase
MSARQVVVMAAMPRELRRVARVRRLRAGTICGLPAWHGHGVLAVAVGVGPARAGENAGRVLDEVDADLVLVIGVAGAVDPALAAGDLVRPERVVDARSGRVFVPAGPGPRCGLLATVEKVSTARPLPAGTTAVDMETAAIAAAAEERGVRWDVLRAISDSGNELTPEVAALLRPDGRTDVLGAARLVVRTPSVARRLVRIGLGSSRAVRAATNATNAALGEISDGA